MLLYSILTVCKVLQVSFLTLWPLKLQMGQMGGQWNHVAPFLGRNIKGTVGKGRRPSELASRNHRKVVVRNLVQGWDWTFCTLNDYQTAACYFATTRETENTRSVGCQVSVRSLSAVLHFCTRSGSHLPCFPGTSVCQINVFRVLQLCPTLCDRMDCSPPGSSVHGILQVAISFSKGSSQPRDWTQISCIAGRFFTVWATGEAYIF